MNNSLITFVFEMVNFVVLFAVLAWLFFKPVRKSLEAQRAKARQQKEEAARTFAEAESVLQEVKTQRQTLSAELKLLQTKSREVAKQEAEQMLTEARAQIERERVALKRELLHIEGAQSASIACAAATAMRAALERFLQQIQGPELEQALIKAACRELQTISNNSLAPVTVESATKIDQDLLALIKTSLGKAAETADFRVVPQLIGGLRISTAHGLIDASITGLANFTEQSLSAEMESMIREESEGD